MSILIFIILLGYGFIFGSFIGALVWRLRQQLDDDGNYKKLSKKQAKTVSISTGRSICPNCRHKLAVKDLIPVISWLSLKGKCRYCKKPIGKQEIILELITGALFGLSYIFWPYNFIYAEWIIFVGYLLAIVCLVALAVYDYRYTILPSRLIYIGSVIMIASYLIYSVITGDFTRYAMALLAGVIYLVIFFGIFLLSELFKKQGWSDKDWLGFGDVRLAFLLGLLIGEPVLVFVAMLVASLIGIVVIAPSLANKKLGIKSQIPFGPFLIAGAIVTSWWGITIIDWYYVNLLGL